MTTEHTNGASLNALTRQRTWENLEDEYFDVVVIGAGVTGSGVALDAASRGLKTLLVDSLDIAGGTSRWSSKLLHGGLRYLATGQVGIALESAQERERVMRRIAPHLAHPYPFVVPRDDENTRLPALIGGLGIAMGDGLRMLAGTPSKVLPSPRIISKEKVLELAPCLQSEEVRWGVLYYDGALVDDARLVIGLARTAAAHGAQVLTRCRAEIAGERQVTLTDALSGEVKTIEPRVVINATGVWSGEIEKELKVMPSRGSHLVVKAERLGNPTAVFTTPVPDHFGRFLLAIPAPDGLVYIGLTDEPDEESDKHDPGAPPEDIDFIMNIFNQCLEKPLEASDIVGTFAGLRPLIYDANSSSTAEMSRRHVLYNHEGAPITIAGGKLTTYRQMAAEAVDAAQARLGLHRECLTADLPLVGAASAEALEGIETSEYRRSHYGWEARRLEELAATYPELNVPAGPDTQVTGIEFLFGALHEGALDASDLLERRTRLSMVAERAEAARPLAEQALALARRELGLELDLER